METIAERLKILVSALGLDQKKFAESLGEKPASVSSWMNEKYNPGLKNIITILSKYRNLSAEWLLLGKGNMWKEETPGNGVVSESPSDYGRHNLSVLIKELKKLTSEIDAEYERSKDSQE